MSKEKFYFSALEAEIAAAPIKTGSVQTWTEYLNGKVNQGKIKADELKYTYLFNQLTELATLDDDGKVSREDLLRRAEASAVEVETIEGNQPRQWYIRDRYGDVLYFDTEDEAQDAYDEELAEIEGEAYWSFDSNESITIYLGEEEREIVKVDRYEFGGEYYDEETTRELLQDEIAEYEQQYPENKPFEITTNRHEDLVIVDKDGDEYECCDCVQHWYDAENDKYYSEFEDARAAANEEVHNYQQDYYDNLSSPDVDSDSYVQDGYTQYRNYSFAHETDDIRYREILLINNSNINESYSSSHWNLTDVIAHIRLSDFDNGKTLFVEELQSDWAQEYRHRDRSTPEGAFIDSTDKWLNLALKKVLHEASVGDYERVAFINGEESARRYSLDKYVERIELKQLENGYTLSGYRYGDYATYTRQIKADEDLTKELTRLIGKEYTEKLLAQPIIPSPEDSIFAGATQTLKEENLVLEAKGMRDFYDNIVPKALSKLLKKLDPEIKLEYVEQYETDNAEQLSFEITDTLREKVQAGQQLFSFAPLYSLDTREHSAFAKAVDKIANREQKAGYIKLGTTPEVLKLIGVPDVRVTINYETINKVIQVKHNVTPETLKQIPREINDPVAVMTSQTKENAYLVLTELTEQVKNLDKPVIAALHLKTTRSGLELINIASVYGRNLSQIQRELDNNLLYWHTKKGSHLTSAFGLQLPSPMRLNENLSEVDIKTQHDLSQEKYQQTKALLTEKLGDAARLITLTDKLPDGSPLLDEGVHLRGSREHGQTYINPERIHALQDNQGKEILSRDERVLWVAHHELFHRGISVIGAEAMRTELEKADRNDFVHQLADAITTERQQIAPEAAPRTRLEAVEEALAEISAARQNRRMDALIERYQKQNPSLKAPKEQSAWHMPFTHYGNAVKNVINYITGREATISNHDITKLIARVSEEATREILTSEQQIQDNRHSFAPSQQSITASKELELNIDGLGVRDIGKAAYKAINGDISKLPELKKALTEKGYKLDEKAIKAAAGHEVTLKDAFTKAVSKVSKAPKKNNIPKIPTHLEMTGTHYGR